jgi:hypothetical protein
MRFVLTGFACAAGFGIAAMSTVAAEPAPSSNGAREWVQPAPTDNAAAPGRVRHHRRLAHRAVRFDPRWRSAADHMANRLNRQELRGGSVYRVYRSASPYDGRFGPSPYATSGH